MAALVMDSVLWKTANTVAIALKDGPEATVR